MSTTDAGRALQPFEWDVDAVVDLLLRPEKFFRRYLDAWPQPSPFLAIWLVGMGNVLEGVARGTGRTFRGLVNEGVAADWLLPLVMVMSRGLIFGFLTWWIGGWLCRLLVRLAGARSPDPRQVRLVVIHAGVVSAVTTLSVALVQMPFHASYAALIAGGRLSRSDFVMAAWVSFIAYRGFVDYFDVRPRRALFWLVLVPIVLVASIFVAVFVFI